jgi:hypothetical protein
MGAQLLFPMDDARDQTFELKRAIKVQRREDRIGKTDLIIKLPYTFTEKIFIVSRTTGNVWYCQAHSARTCHHIKAIKRILRLQVEAGYTDQSDKAFLKQVLPTADVR